MSVTVPTATSPIQETAKRVDKASTARRVGRALSFKQKKALKAKHRKSRILFHYTKEELEPYFHISQKEAAKHLGIAVITLKRICKRGKFNWPYRANKLQERNNATAAGASRSPTKSKATKKNSAARRSTAPQSTFRSSSRQQRSPSYPAFVGETRATQEAMRRALESLALCAVKIEQEEERAQMTAAAMAFSQLPLWCMRENDGSVTL